MNTKHFALGLLSGLGFFAGPASAQLVTDTLLADINSAPTVVGSYSGGFVSNGSLVWFDGIDSGNGQGYRIWATDGTAAGSVQLTDFALNEYESVIGPGGDAFILGDELGVGEGLWRSDGTAGGTVKLIGSSAWTQAPFDLTVFGGDVWFLAGTTSTGVEVWKSNLATGVTALAIELTAGPSSGASQLFAGGGKLYVAGPGQASLFATDGTAAGLTLLETFSLASATSFSQVGEVGPRVIFEVSAPGGDRGWWSSDGTPAGTLQFDTSFNTRWLVQAATKVYYTSGPQNGDLRLFETDGTPAGTLPVDLPGTVNGQRVDFAPGTALGDDLFYGGYVGNLGVEPCRTSGAAGGARALADLHSGAADSKPTDFVAFGGSAFFRAEDGLTGREIWEVDLATNAVTLTSDLWPGPFAGIVGSSPTLQPSANGVVFGQNFPLFGVEPAVTDGVTSQLLINIGDDGLSGGSGPSEFFRLGNQLFFQALDEVVGSELYVTDGSAAGTQLFVDIDPVTGGFPGAFGSFPHHFVEFEGRAVFYAFHSAFGRELWSTDGTISGTELLIDLVPGPGGSEPLFSRPAVVLGDELFFVALDPSQGMLLMKSDGTAAGTQLVKVTDTTGFVAEFVQLFVVGERVVFNVNGAEGHELWTTDGTPANTELLADINPGPADSFFSGTAVGHNLAFVSVSVGTDRTLWRTDGKPAGTQQFLSQPSNGFFGPSNLQAHGDRLYFSLEDAATGREPWTSDGTPAGTQLLADLAPGPDSSTPFSFTPAGDRVFFTAFPVASGHWEQLWTTDGSGAGTQFVAELNSPIAGPGIGTLWAPGSDRRILFTNVDAAGQEWWTSDGTLAGTLPLADIDQGPGYSNPSVGVLVKNQLVFRADDGVNGAEPHAIPLALTGGYAATNLGSGCAGLLGEPALSFDSGAIALGDSFTIGVESAAPGTALVWLFDLAYGSVPIGGACNLQLPVPRFFTSTAADAAGASSLAIGLPNSPALVGAQIDFQVLSVELAGPFLGVGALSDVLEIVIGS